MAKYVKVPEEDMSLITCVIDVMESIAPAQYKEQVRKVYKWLHEGKYELTD